MSSFYRNKIKIKCVTKSLKLKYCSRSSLPCMLSNPAAQKVQKMQKRNPRRRKRSERPAAVFLTINRNETPPQTLPQKHREFQNDLFQEHLWRTATRVSAF